MTAVSKGSKTSSRMGGFLRGKLAFNLPQIGLIAGILAIIGVVAVVATHAASATPVPCTNIGGGHYNCSFYTTAPVLNGSGAQVGTLHAGTNWVVCQQWGRQVTSGTYYNHWWAWTLSDQNTSGWVNAVYARGGDNDGQFGGVPNCEGRHGNPPQGTFAYTGSCSLTVPATATTGTVVTPKLSVKNTGTATFTPAFTITLAVTDLTGFTQNYKDYVSFSSLAPGGSTYRYLTARPQDSMAQTRVWESTFKSLTWYATSSDPGFSCRDTTTRG